jgi:arsenate reductase (thioredoxin)
MSEALFRRAAEGRHEARSAGTTPGERVHPEVVEAMERRAQALIAELET